MTNTGTAVRELAVESPSCGCLGFRLALGASGILSDLSVGQKWQLGPGESALVDARFPLTSRAGSIERGFNLVASENGNRIHSRRITWRDAIHEDIVVDPPALQCVHRNGAIQSGRLALTITICAERHEAATPPQVDLTGVDWLRLKELSRVGRPEALSSGRERHRYLAEFERNSERLPDVSDPLGSPNARSLLFIRLAVPKKRGAEGTPNPSVDVPVAVKDAGELEAPESIQFGVVRAGSEVKRMVLISSRDSGPFSLTEARVEGTGEIDASVAPKNVGRFQMIAVTFTASEPGKYRGKLVLVPGTGDYKIGPIAYSATVSEQN